MSDQDMGGAQSRRSARLLRRNRQAAERAAADQEDDEEMPEESDPDFRVEAHLQARRDAGEETSDEESVDGAYYLEGDSSDEEEGATRGGVAFGVSQIFMHLGGIAGGRRGARDRMQKRLDQYGPVPHDPPLLENQFAQEAGLKTAAEDPRFPSFPAGKVTAKNKAGVPVMNAASLLWLRQANLGGSGRGWLPAQCCHMLAFHYLPNRPINVRARMHSRAYIGQHSRHGNLFVGAFQADKKVRVYDTERGWRLVKDIHARNLRWTITDTCLSRDQNFLLYSTINPVVHMVNVGVGGVESEANVTEIHEALHLDEMDGTPEGYHGHFGIYSIRWSGDGREIVAGTGDSSILIYDMEKQKTTLRIRGHKDDVNAVAFLDEGSNILLSGSDDHLVQVWDRRALGRSNARPAGVLVGHTQGITHIDPKGDGRYLLSNCKDQTAKVWDVRKMLSQGAFSRLPDPDLPDFGWDYRWMDYPARNYHVRHPNDCSVQTFRGHYVATTLIRAYFSPLHTTGQRYVYSASADGCVYIYDTVSSKLVEKLSYHRPDNPNREILRDVSWHPFEPSIVTAGFDGSLVEWGCSEDSMKDHLERLGDTGYDRLEDEW